MRARALRALAIVAAVVATTVGCGSFDQSESARQQALVDDGYAQARGGVKLALPVAVPEGYRLTRFWSVANVYTERGKPESIARSAEFSGPGGPVRVCEEVAKIPGDLCPRSNIGITEKKDGLVRTVSMETTPQDDPRAVWGEVGYSSALADWSWLSPPA
ncbi:hypothetical protein KIH74_22055 [Kineosporia sp. J2-2]|uniref:Lipoprotein n=1 Tax=Kineosporia corallincola TaxID=2835133 RepID=A0ABS5TPW4_9ACTN|nr:hypothetical protein [Kineosporia corallincola]MBT0771639.1 hypothetical protein [Kineosporia corallincola]